MVPHGAWCRSFKAFLKKNVPELRKLMQIDLEHQQPNWKQLRKQRQTR